MLLGVTHPAQGNKAKEGVRRGKKGRQGVIGGSVARWIPLVRLPERPIYLHSQGLGHHLGENISSSGNRVVMLV